MTRYAVGADEVLFLDAPSFADRSKNVRGGVPVLFPVAGPPPPLSLLKQHGFARLLPWESEVVGADSVRLTLDANESTRALWPHEFRVEYTVELVGTRLELRWMIHNRDDKPMPLHFGLHPYFSVPVAAKAAARVETSATRAFDNRTKTIGPVPPLSFSGEELDAHLLDHGAKGTVLDRGDGTSVPLQWSQSFDTLVLWTLPGAAFICVEPWSGPAQAALVGERPQLPAGDSASFAFVIGS